MMNNWGGNWLDTYFELAPELISCPGKKFASQEIHGAE
jgi:hypothetical protein